MSRREAFPPEARLRTAEEIRATRRAGRRHRQGALELFAAPSPSGRPRVGVVVPRHGRTIVERNRLKRRLRELARRIWLPAARDSDLTADLLIRCLPEAYDASAGELRASFRAGLETIRWPAESSPR